MEERKNSKGKNINKIKKATKTKRRTGKKGRSRTVKSGKG
jgi:hypothetical protein